MRNLVNAVNNRDGKALSAMAPPEKPKQQITQQAVSVFNELFRQLKAAFPALMVSIKTQEDLNELRRQWVLSFAENGIHSIEQVNAGMKVARKQEMPFLPSPGQFVAWCNQEESLAAGLPDEEQLYEMFRLYCRDRGIMGGCDNYPWESPACFHIITAVYGQMQSFNLADSECRKRLTDETRKISRRIKAGEVLPEPRKQIPQLHIPSKPDVAKSHIANLKQMLKKSRHN